jgi:hypothetical protein
MSPPRNPVDRLRESNPVPLEEAPSPDSPQARALLERIIGIPRQARPAKRWISRQRLWVLVPAALLAAAGATYGLVRSVRQPLVVACYQEPNLQADRAVVPATGGNPVDACGVLWRPGGKFNPSGHGPVPPLTPCVLDSGATGVFPSVPGSDTCSGLGLARPRGSPNEQSENQRVLAVQDALATEFLSSCDGGEQAMAFVRQQLMRYGLQGWRVVARMPFTEREPCASVAFDLPHRTISLVPVSNSISP